MESLGIDFSFDQLIQLWNGLVDYSVPLLVPTLGSVLLAAVLFFVGGWILKRLQKRLAARTETDLDDELVRTVRHAFKLTVIAWALWRLLASGCPYSARNTDGDWVAYATQPRDWCGASGSRWSSFP